MDEGPDKLFNAAVEYSDKGKKEIAAATAVALHELVLAAWSIDRRLTALLNHLEEREA